MRALLAGGRFVTGIGGLFVLVSELERRAVGFLLRANGNGRGPIIHVRNASLQHLTTPPPEH